MGSAPTQARCQQRAATKAFKKVAEEPVPPPPVCKNVCKKFFKKMADEKVCDIKTDCQGCVKCVELLAGPTEAPVTTAAPKYSKKCTKVSGKDWTSGEIGKYRTGSYSKCESKCVGDRSCKTFVFVKGSCHLFREVVKKGKVVNTMKNRKGHVGGICDLVFVSDVPVSVTVPPYINQCTDHMLTDCSSWSDKYTNGCSVYEKDGHCANGTTLSHPDNMSGGSEQTDANAPWSRPDEDGANIACCVCGGGSSVEA